MYIILMIGYNISARVYLDYSCGTIMLYRLIFKYPDERM